MANALVGHLAITARHIGIGTASVFDVEEGQLLQVIDLAGKQVASLLAFSADGQDRLSTTVTITANASIVLKRGDKVFSQLRTPMFEIVEDMVGRHDLLTSPLPEEKPASGTAVSHGSTLGALSDAAREAGMELPDLTDPINFFKHVVIKQRGELDIRDSLSERGDSLILRALVGMRVVIANALPEKRAGVAVATPFVSKDGALLIRVYR